ncbi:MAG: hypothetical protein KAQ62_26775 [Cyclobacteriaceae bacterium]|nr:hypothetical protein [Cyclobacteriaceae bacterium]
MFDSGCFIGSFYSRRHKENCNYVFSGCMMGSSQILVLTASIAEKYMQTLPDYEQSKKEMFYEAKKRYFDEINKEIPDRDDDLVGKYHDKLYLILEAFYSEIYQS